MFDHSDPDTWPEHNSGQQTLSNDEDALREEDNYPHGDRKSPWIDKDRYCGW